MDDRRVGLIVRALRRRRGWRQVDLACAAGRSQGMVSLVERGHLDRVSLRVVRLILAALEATAVIEVRWRAGALDRLLDEDHARLVGVIAERLRRANWSVETEVTYAHYREHGSYDILAFHPSSGIVLVVECKTDLPSVEGALRKVDEKVRLAPMVARERFGWQPNGVARLLVMPEISTLRRRVGRHAELLRGSFPSGSVHMKQWIASPSGPAAGLWFLSPTNAHSGIRRPGGRERVRRPTARSGNDEAVA